MTNPTVQQERRRLNDEIETAHLATVRAAANVRLALVTGKGNYISKYSDLYQWLSHLITLTCDLKELDPDADDVGKAIAWVDQPCVASLDDTALIAACDAGIAMFRMYNKLLMRRGIISLPTRRG